MRPDPVGMAFRAPRCAFCQQASFGVCPRCDARVCEAHSGPLGSSSGRWCAVCEEERRDEVDSAVALAQLRGVPDYRGRDGTEDVGMRAVALFARWLSRRFRTRRSLREAQALFERRSAAEIAAYRASHRTAR